MIFVLGFGVTCFETIEPWKAANYLTHGYCNAQVCIYVIWKKSKWLKPVDSKGQLPTFKSQIHNHVTLGKLLFWASVNSLKDQVWQL